MIPWPEDPIRRCLVVGAIAGVVLELVLVAGLLGSRWLPPIGLEPDVHRTVELLPLLAVGGLAFLVGLGAFGLAIGLALRPPRLSAGRGGRRSDGRRSSPG